jgi:hypothetical protein
LQRARIAKLQSSTKAPIPSVGSVARNLANSAIRNIKSVAAGNPLKATDQEGNNRLNICKSCEFFNTIQQRCNKCGCYMAVKTYLKAEKCPIGKW